MIFRVIVFLFILCLIGCGCQSTKSNSHATGGSATKIQRPSSEIGDVRIAFLSKQVNIVLVNEGSRQYLQLEMDSVAEDAQEIPLSAYKYKSKALSLNAKNSIRIVKDPNMRKLMELAQQVAFCNFARTITAEELQNLEMQGQEGILVEKQGSYYFLQKEKSMFNVKLQTPEGRAYRSMKFNMLQVPGDNVLFVKQGLGGGQNEFRTK